ncbi:hypothetical protein [Cellulosimicrobium sp. CUA-896]|uniref:hypothetical protein n=1 Tax=Cellulosimicrobium sp. CUA-896 TaxID=1517881 RepID=UPI0021013556|nr:hypothetical protein [Cellulosimicrobium sp. CUA-896]
MSAGHAPAAPVPAGPTTTAPGAVTTRHVPVVGDGTTAGSRARRAGTAPGGPSPS